MKQLSLILLFSVFTFFSQAQIIPIDPPNMTVDDIFVVEDQQMLPQQMLPIWRSAGATPIGYDGEDNVVCVNFFELLLIYYHQQGQDVTSTIGEIRIERTDFQAILNSTQVGSPVNTDPATATKTIVFMPATDYIIVEGSPSVITAPINIPPNVILKGAGAGQTNLYWEGVINTDALIEFTVNNNPGSDIPYPTNSGIECLTISGSRINVGGEEPITKDDFFANVDKDIFEGFDELRQDYIDYLLQLMSFGVIQGAISSTPNIDALAGRTLVRFSGADNCWINNCKTYMGFGSHIEFIENDNERGASNITVQGNHIHSNWLHGTFEGKKTQGLGVVFSGDIGSIANRIENNIIHDTRHGIMIQRQAANNVIGYNYVFDNWSFNNLHAQNTDFRVPHILYQVRPNEEMDITIHSTMPVNNLFEGNVVDYIAVENYRDVNSNNGTQFFYRNRVRERFWVHGSTLLGNGYCGNSKNGEQVLVANYVDDYDISSQNHKLHWNADFSNNSPFPNDLNTGCIGSNTNHQWQVFKNALGESCYLTENKPTEYFDPMNPKHYIINDWIPDSGNGYDFPWIGAENGSVVTWKSHAHYRYHSNNYFQNPSVTCGECVPLVNVDALNDAGVSIPPVSCSYDIDSDCNNSSSLNTYKVTLTNLTGGVPPFSGNNVTFSAGSGANFTTQSNLQQMGLNSVIVSGYGMLAGPLEINFIDGSGTSHVCSHIVMCGNNYRIQNPNTGELQTVSEEELRLREDRKIFTNSIAIAPNPITSISKLTYTVAKNNQVNIRLLDALGRVQQELENTQKDVGEYNVMIEKRNLAAGIYFCEVRIGEYREVMKVVIQ